MQEGWERIKPIPPSWFNGRIVEKKKRKRKKTSKGKISDTVIIGTENAISGSVTDQPQLPQDISRDEEFSDEDEDEDEDEMTDEWSTKQVQYIASLVFTYFIFLAITPHWYLSGSTIVGGIFEAILGAVLFQDSKFFISICHMVTYM